MSEYSAVLRLKFLPHVERQFGPYRKACAALTCESSKGRIAMVPLRLHNLPMSTVTDRRCIVNGDECCEWEVRWSPEPARRTVWPMWGAMAGAASFAYLRVAHPTVSLMEALLIALVPVLVSWVAMSRRVRRETFKREALIQEQVKFVEARHEELREAYLEQEQTRVQLRRKVNQLTALHQAGLLFNATLDRETLLSNVLETLVKELHYDRAMITFYDPVRRVTAEARVIGVTPEVQAFARSREIPVSDPNTVEGLVLLQGKPLLIGDIREWVDRMHPLNRRLAALTGTKSVIAVPLKTKDRILGSLTVDRMQEHSLNEDDLELMVTLANQVVIALDNVSAYRQIEELNVGLEAKVRERTAELEQADRIRTLFLRHVSHELRTPLTSMKGFIENMLDGLTGPLNEKQQAYLTRVLDNESRLIRMIEDLLDRTRIETGRLELVPSNVDLDACLAEVVEHLRPLAEAKRQALEASVPSSFPQVWADRDRLIQIVVNLVQNAIKFTPAGGRIGVAVEEAGEHFAGVRVRDNGPGIPSEYLEKIFDPFFRITQGQKGGPKGLGLGLSIVKTLVELHGGSITARSGPWQGAELSFTIPFVPDKAGPSRASASETKCVLVVDDDLDLQKMLSDRLGARGYRVETSGDGQHAVDAIRAQAFSGVMLDIGLPQLDGIEVLRRIRQVNEQVPVVVMTVWGTQQLAVQAISMGAQAYVLKPFDLAELQRVLDTWFGPIGHGGS
jgi:signal transduction histidine kinase